MEDLTDRITHLEKSNRRLKLVVLGAFLLAAAKPVPRQGFDKPDELVLAKRIVIPDPATGATRVEINSEGIWMGGLAKQSVALGFDGGLPRLRLSQPASEKEIYLGFRSPEAPDAASVVVREPRKSAKLASH